MNMELNQYFYSTCGENKRILHLENKNWEVYNLTQLLRSYSFPISYIVLITSIFNLSFIKNMFSILEWFACQLKISNYSS